MKSFTVGIEVFDDFKGGHLCEERVSILEIVVLCVVGGRQHEGVNAPLCWCYVALVVFEFGLVCCLRLDSYDCSCIVNNGEVVEW